MASDPGNENEDNWLYGDSNPEPPDDPETSNDKTITDEPNNLPEPEIQDDNIEPPEVAEKQDEPDASLPPEELPPGVEQDNPPDIEDKEEKDDNEDGENSDKADSDDDSDDDVNVVIGDIKTSSTYTALNLKRGGLVTASSNVDKIKQTGKFSIDEFESIGTINGVSAQEYNLDSMEDKPWRKPGADITDYFNYGFNEDTWRAYCERQKRMRVHESGVGLMTPMNSIGLPRAPTSITNDNSKYSGNFTGPRKAGPPPGRRMTGSIDVIGGNTGLASRRGAEAAALKTTPPKENVIPVMTADRREYSRKPGGFPDMSVPPPAGFDGADMSMPPPGFDNYQGDFFNPEPEPYYGGYEPTQDCQWNPNAPNWVPTEIKELTPGPAVIPPVGGNNMGPPTMVPPPFQDGPPEDFDRRERSRDRERERDDSPSRESSRSRSEKPDRHRERSHRRERSRSRSRRHKSRSRSPSHRSHRKKKSRRHDKDDSD